MFSAATLEDWEQLVRAKAKDPAQPLTTELEDGLAVKWLYTAADLPADSGQPPTHQRGGQWQIRQLVAFTSADAANALVLEELEGGATEVMLELKDDAATELEAILVGVHLEMAGVALDCSALEPQAALAAARALTDIWRASQTEPDEVRGSLGLSSVATVAEALALSADFPQVRALSVDTGAWVDRGAGARDELALALSAGIELLRAGEAAGLDAGTVASEIEFTLIAGADQFLEICKLRAFRRLWGRVLEECGAGGELEARVYARTSRRMMSSLDPWVNMLRATTATFAAGVGGADGVTVVAFDEPYGQTNVEPGPLGRRIARNTQLLLLEEAHLAKVSDPAGGSWYVEALTEQLAAAAWERLQTPVDPQTAIAAAVDARQHQIATRQRELTGVNTFPLLGDDGLQRDPDARELAIKVVRDGAQFEQLRARAAGLKPAMLLDCLGPLSSNVAITQWAKNFFEAGGVQTFVDDPGGLTVAAVCPGKGVPEEEVAAAVSGLRERGFTRVYVAGKDVHNGIDMISVLDDLLSHFEELPR